MGIIEFLLICGLCAGLYWVLGWFGANALIMKIALVAIGILLVVLLLQALGLFPLRDVQIPRLR